MNNGTNNIKPFNSSDFKPKIVGGIPAELEGNEHMVSIRSKAHENILVGTGHLCGGSLIAPNLVLTVAACLLDKSFKPVTDDYIVVVMGALSLSDRIFSHKREVSRVAVHNKFNKKNFDNNIGLLHLKRPFELSSSIKLIPYARNADYSVGQSAVLSGWGSVVQGGFVSENMRTTIVKIVDRDDCKRAYYGYDITDTMFCAADGTQDACDGDTGGPLVLKGIQYGIVSWGKGCGIPGVPSVYTDVSSYDDWIARGSGNMIIIHSAAILSLFVAYFIVA